MSDKVEGAGAAVCAGVFLGSAPRSVWGGGGAIRRKSRESPGKATEVAPAGPSAEPGGFPDWGSHVPTVVSHRLRAAPGGREPLGACALSERGRGPPGTSRLPRNKRVEQKHTEPKGPGAWRRNDGRVGMWVESRGGRRARRS